jgi:hypothetical protein
MHNTQSFVDDIIPSHIRNDYPDLINFIKVYAAYLEDKNNAGFYLNQLDKQRDIATITEDLLESLQREIGVSIPRNIYSDPRLFYQHLIEFYRSRGTPNSITAFFKLVYLEDVEVYFPKDDMLSPSASGWQDLESAITADPSSYVPAYTWTLTSSNAGDTIDFADDNSQIAKFEDDIIFVNDVLVTNYKELITYNSSTTTNEHSLKFDSALSAGDVIKAFVRGSFKTRDGMPSELKYIQDSYFYQKFSYVLKSGMDFKKWEKDFSRLVHPSGFIFFGEIFIFIKILLTGIPVIQPGSQVGGLPFMVFIPVTSFTSQAIQGNIMDKILIEETDPDRRIGPWDHFDNTKFHNPRPNRDYRIFTLEDVINKRIGFHFGSTITIT